MPSTALLIPTLDLILAKRCLDSFRLSLQATESTAIVVYNGSNDSVQSNFSNNAAIIIGYTDSEEIAAAFASAAGCSTEFLFGRQDFCRSYGGASNLLLAIGYAVGAKVLAKVDDDCVEIQPPARSWLAAAQKLLREYGGVGYGSYVEAGLNYLDLLPTETAHGILRYCYPEQEFSGRLTKAPGSALVKNGNLVLTRVAASSSCYQILLEPITRTSARGEAYFWKDELIQKGIAFTYSADLALFHDPVSRKLGDWLRSIVVGYDLSLNHRVHKLTGKYLSRKEREQAIREFRQWLMDAEIPEMPDLSKPGLVSLVQEDLLIRFTDSILSELPRRYGVWNTLMKRDDLPEIIHRFIPVLD